MEAQKQNFLEILHTKIVEKLNDYEESMAFVRLAAELLNYEALPDENFIDGFGDFGSDFWQKSDAGFEIFQVKSHEIENGKIDLSKFDKEGILDLNRILNYLLNDKSGHLENNKLKILRHEWDDAISRILMAKSKEIKPLRINAALVIFGEDLTGPARQELDNVSKSFKRGCYYREVPIEVNVKLFTIDDLIRERWRQDNREWKDKYQAKRNSINLTPEITHSGPQLISSNNNAVFYTRAIDLIHAFEDFGYQIFEPNVRANIRKSTINAAIRDALSQRKSRKEFKFLNNGVTITCKSFSKPSENRKHFTIVEPGIVNGLQTVNALHEAYYKELDADDKKDLEENCYVLVRVINDNAVSEINDVVIASNTQNPMQPRNLKSNTNEQILYEKLFAELGWFYERKQGAWDAFSSDPLRWRTLSNYKRKHFQIDDSHQFRKVDNHSLGQAWLAFIGFSDEAVHDRRFIFDKSTMYDVTFLHRTSKHGAELDYDMEQAKECLKPNSPSPQMMLVSYLANRFAKSVALSLNETREEAYQRLKLDPNSTSKANIDAQLSLDERYILESVLGGMSFVFTEFFGYLIFKAVGDKFQDVGSSLVATSSLNQLFTGFEKALPNVTSRTREEEIVEDDLLPIAWFAFRTCIEQMLGGAWKFGYQNARSRTRFNHSAETRKLLNQKLNQLDKFMQKSQVFQPWAIAIPQNKGLFRYFREVIEAKR
jgi:hypothetical protein